MKFFFSGGCKNGKSTIASHLAVQLARGGPLYYVATMVPQDAGFDHAEGNSDAHIKTTLHGPSLMLIVEDGQLQLGRWQSIYLCEGDGPRQRTLWAQWLPGEDSTRP